MARLLSLFKKENPNSLISAEAIPTGDAESNRLQSWKHNAAQPLLRYPYEVYHLIIADLGHVNWLMLAKTCRLLRQRMIEDRATIIRLHSETRLSKSCKSTESSDVQSRLRRDTFRKLYLQYKIQPDPSRPLCYSCLSAHPRQLFFPRQLLQADEPRSCKTLGVLAICPCFAIPACSLQILSPWGQPSETKFRILHSCQLRGKINTDVIISCSNNKALRVRILHDYPGGILRQGFPSNQIKSLLRTAKEAKLMLCPHLLVDDPMIRRLRRLHQTDWYLFGNTATRCHHKDCRTTVDWFTYPCLNHPQTVLRVERDLQLLPGDDILKRTTWLAQILDPVQYAIDKGIGTGILLPAAAWEYVRNGRRTCLMGVTG